MDPRYLVAARAYVALLPRCHHYDFAVVDGVRTGPALLCGAMAFWHDAGLFACEVHGGAENPWGRPLVEVVGAAELRELLAALAEADANPARPSCPVLPPPNPFSRPYRAAGGHLFESGPPPVGNCTECGVNATAWQSLATCPGRAER